MKTQIEFKKSEWVFSVGGTQVTVRWDYKGKEQVGWQNCKQYSVSCIIYNDGSGLLNRVCDQIFITSLQPNYGNSLDYLKRIMVAQSTKFEEPIDPEEGHSEYLKESEQLKSFDEK